MIKPFLTLTSKDFMTGIAPAAHVQGHGLFFKADGVTPLVEAGASQSVNNGLLMPGAAATTVGGSLNGTVWSSAGSTVGGSAYFGTSSGHIFTLTLDTAFGSSLSDAHTVGGGETLTPGMCMFTDASAVEWLIYRNVSHIARNGAGDAYNDTWSAVTADYFGAIYPFQNKVYFGNGAGKVGSIDSAMAVTTTKLTIPAGYSVSAISDDGTYVILAITTNRGGATDIIGSTRILFWDGATTASWLREYTITDPFIYAMKKTPIGIFAFGITGIWQVSIGGVKKVFNRPPGVYTVNGLTSIHYGNAVSFFSDSVIWGGTSGSNYAIKSLGKLDSAYPNACLHPFLSTAGKNITHVNGQLLKGWVFVGDDTPLLKAYPFSGSVAAQTGNIAQTIYLEVPDPIQITRVRVTFGEPLASGDTLGVGIFTDEDTSVFSYGSVSFSSTKTTRSKTFVPATLAATANDHFSLKLTYTAGQVKIKKIEFFGDPAPQRNDI